MASPPRAPMASSSAAQGWSAQNCRPRPRLSSKAASPCPRSPVGLTWGFRRSTGCWRSKRSARVLDHTGAPAICQKLERPPKGCSIQQSARPPIRDRLTATNAMTYESAWCQEQPYWQLLSPTTECKLATGLGAPNVPVTRTFALDLKRARPHALTQLAQLPFRLLKPVGHAHFAVHRHCGGEVLLGLLAIAPAAVTFAEAEVPVSYLRKIG